MATRIHRKGSTNGSMGFLSFLALAAALRALRALLPEGEVLGQAGTKILSARCASIDLDEAEDRRESPQEAEPLSLGLTRRVRLMAQVGVLGFRRDLVLSESDPGWPEGFLADLFSNLVEAVAHVSPVRRFGGVVRERQRPCRENGAAEAP